MNYQLVKEVIELIERFDEKVEAKSYSKDLGGFKRWIYDSEKRLEDLIEEPDWEGKDKGRSPESAINTLIVHMNRYAKNYSKSAIYSSDFSTQEDFIYLINLKAFGAMTKMELIRKNIQDKTVGMQIINRLIKHGWVQQSNSLEDKRSKIILITEKGIEALAQIMEKIRQATKIVTGNLSYPEKLKLIVLLQKLEHFHEPIYSKNLDLPHLVDIAYSQLT
ncbi:MAG: winged helix DNA-binding protein [Pedobacter sp.]|uniref:MarR family winged helix-turn-helix transcriptional regulator n=1 Tax=Pedobacter sp. TaxID=1411316 RepID=UPI0035662C5B